MNTKYTKRFLLSLAICVVAAWLTWQLAQFGGHLATVGREVVTPLPMGPLCPARDESSGPSGLSMAKTPRGQAAIAFDAQQGLPENGQRRPAFDARAAIAKLYMGKDVEKVNTVVCNAIPWNESGSTWWGHPSGDYDFAETDMIALLYLFQDQPDRLYPETAKHIVDVLLIENGVVPRPKVPRSLGLVVETENHTLMTEGARYLKNQWYRQHGTPEQRANPAYDNDRNGLGDWLLGYLRSIQEAGFHEFNSIPYMSYGMRALLNLEAFPANHEIRSTARYIIDIANWQYALGSLDLRRCAPFRRQSQRAGLTGLRADEHTWFMEVWTSSPGEAASTLPFSPREETIAEAMPYRLPVQVRQWTLAKSEDYFVRFGHGPKASPELYSGGPDYLLSAGGVNRGLRSEIAARPITLILRDGATDVRDCFHLTGRGAWRTWNNTGVCRRFACSNGEVHVPANKRPAASSGGWQVYDEPKASDLLIALRNAPGFGLLVLLSRSSGTCDDAAKALAQANPNESEIRRAFQWPSGGSVGYDVNAPKGLWVITAIDGKPVNRTYDSWAQLDGDGPKVSFAR